MYGRLDRKRFFKSETSEKEGYVLSTISSATSGISIGELTDKVGLDPKTVRRYTAILLQRGLIRRVSRGKTSYGKFFATKAGLRDVKSRAIILGNLFAQKILQERLMLVHSDNLTRSGCVDFSSIPQFLTADNNRSSLIRSLFEFSTAIGAFVVYILIQSMKKRTSFSELLIESALLQIIPYLLPTFKSYVEEPLSNYFKFENQVEMLDFLFTWYKPSSNFNTKIIQKLSVSLGRLYPYLWYEIDKINGSFPRN
jgi:hypothetical protein